ncbi:MAG: MltA-interacting MipA family protein [Gammaproteobacteria bacterium]|nr:MltA-interacting MipA family protein [Gammaproteobacteria bacterium]
MNDFRLPTYEKRAEPGRDRRSANLSFGVILPLALWSAGMRPSAAETILESTDAPSAVAEEKEDSGVPDPFSDKWKFVVGGGIVNGARYPGSRDNFTRGLPLVSVSYGRFFLGAVPGTGAPAGAGAYLLHTEHWAIGVDVGGDARKPRRSTDDPILRGWGDIKGTVRGGLFASYTYEWLSVRTAISDDVGGHHEGVLATLAVEAKYHATQRLTLSIGPEVTWVNERYARTFFGIDAAQSEIAGIAPYRARSGINTLGGSAGATYMLTDHWSLGAHVSYGKLQGDAADSPVTTDKTQRMYGAFFMYRF